MRAVIGMCCLVLCVACGSKSDKPKTAEVTPEFKAYLQFKRIPLEEVARVDNARKQYDEQVALAAAVQNTELGDSPLVQAEIAESQRQILTARYFEQFLQKAVTEDAVKNYYALHAADYEQTKAHLAHIFFRLHEQMSEAEKEAKMIKAREVYTKLQGKEAFDTLAKNYSEDTQSANKGGDLGWMRKGAVDPVFSQQAFALAEGGVSQPFASALGIHIVKLIEAPQQVKQPFEQVQGDIGYQLRQEAKTAELARLLGQK